MFFQENVASLLLYIHFNIIGTSPALLNLYGALSHIYNTKEKFKLDNKVV